MKIVLYSAFPLRSLTHLPIRYLSYLLCFLELGIRHPIPKANSELGGSSRKNVIFSFGLILQQLP